MNLSKTTKERYGDPDLICYRLDASGQRVQNTAIWGFGGYLANAIDASLRRDDPDGFVDLMRAAELTAKAETLDGLTMEQYCDKRGASKCKAALKAIP